ncbi:MAG: DUF4197 domain-containing protein, partial [Acidobacteria bacterium]
MFELLRHRGLQSFSLCCSQEGTMSGMRRTVVAGVLVGILAAAAAEAQGIPPIGGIAGRGAATESRIALGLREALTVGADNAVARTGRLDGFFMNEAIKILMPERLRQVETGLRAIGYGPKVDEFILAMNRAAERAAASAKPIFWEAIHSITIEDAIGILNGGETAATEYFRGRTEDGLAAAFRPVVQQATDETGVTRQYKDLIRALPFGNPE